MSKRYQVLARKYRPQTFSDVVAQEHVVTTLKNAIRFDRPAHAYLFCGSRGVGKTTIARLFAKALNCQSLAAGFEPCNQCPSCLEISSGQSLDVIEIDGASNRGIDDIRQINETVGYAPSKGRYKIYIIDEVHMLTKEAFNALLKTLEEPPEQAKFFFATTEAHKVLPTIISRCQRFDLARIPESQITAKLREIALDLNRETEEEALELIAAFSEGSLRDAESLFDQILCFSEETISAAIVRQNLGLAPKEIFRSLDEAFASCHLPAAFEIVEQLLRMGKDLGHFLEQLIEHYRNVVHAKCSNLPEGKLYTQAQAFHILDLLVAAEGSFQKSAYQRIALESILLQIIRSKNRIPIEVLVRHLTENGDKIQLSAPTLDTPFLSSEPAKLSKESGISPSPELINAISDSSFSNPSRKQSESAKTDPSLQNGAVMEPNNPNPSKAAPQIPSEELPKSLSQTLSPSNQIELPPPPSIESSKSLKAVPFNPYTARKEELKEPIQPSIVTQKPQSHYDTLIRFAAVEFEGIIKN